MTTKDFDFSDMQVTASSGIDSLFNHNPELIKPHRTRVASVADISGFSRISSETLIHKATKDLWALRQTPEGGYFIERLFDDNGEPLKG